MLLLFCFATAKHLRIGIRKPPDWQSRGPDVDVHQQGVRSWLVVLKTLPREKSQENKNGRIDALEKYGGPART